MIELVVVLVTILFLIILSKNTIKNSLASALITIYIFWYGFWLCISTFNVLNLHAVSMQTYLYQLLGVAMLTLGFLFHPDIIKQPNPDRFKQSFTPSFERSINFKVFYAIFFVYAFSVFLTFRELIYIGGNDARQIYFFGDETSLFGHRYLKLLWVWFGTPFYYFVLLLLSIRILSEKLRDFWTLLYALFLIFFGYVGAGRLGVVLFVEMIFMLYIIMRHTTLYKTKMASYLMSLLKNPLRLIGLLSLSSMIILAFGYLTSLRLGNPDLTLDNSLKGLSSFFTQVVVYNIGPFRAFDYALSNDYIIKIGQLYGRGTLASVDHVIATFFAYFRIELYVPSNELIGSVLQEEPIDIGGEFTHFNYAYTQFLIFYLDFRFVGILVIPFIYGYFYRKAVNYFIIKANFFSLLLLLYLSLSLIGSNFSYTLQPINAFVLLALTIYLSRKVNFNK